VNMRGHPVHGLEGLVALREKYHEAFGDLTFHTNDIVAGPLNAKHEFLMSWNATATHTGDFNGIKPLMKGVTNEYYGVSRVTLDRDGTKIVHVQAMHGTFILEQIGMYNHLVVDTQSLGDTWISFWNHEIDDISSLVTQDVKMIDNINMKGVNKESMLTGVEGIKAMRAFYKEGFSDMKFIGKNEATPMVGDKFILSWTFRGTNNGEVMGVPPTGKQITLPGANIIKMKAGKIAECHVIHSKHMWTELGVFKGMGDKIEL